MPPPGDLARNPGMCPDWELNLQAFVSQAGAQSTEPHQPGQYLLIYLQFLFIFLRLSLLIFRKRGREGKREGDKYWCARETSTGRLCHVPQTRAGPATQACALTGNEAGDLLLCGMVLNQTLNWLSLADSSKISFDNRSFTPICLDD